MKKSPFKKRILNTVLATSIVLSGLTVFPASNVLANDPGAQLQQQLMAAPKGLSQEEVVHSFLHSKVNTFQSFRSDTTDVDEQFTIVEQKADEQTETYHFRTQEQYKGIPVYGGEQTVTLDGDNNVIAYFGKVTQDLSRVQLDTDADLTEAEAKAVVKEMIEAEIGEVKEYDGIEIELVIYQDGDENKLVYFIEASTSLPAPGHYHAFVNAKNGEIVHSYNRISEPSPVLPVQTVESEFEIVAPNNEVLAESVPATARGIDIFGKMQTVEATKDVETGEHYLFDGTRSNGIHTFGANRMPETSFILLSGLLGFSGFEVTSPNNFFYDPAAVSAHVNAGKVYDYFKNVHGRDSLDDNGMKLISTVHIGDKWNNAAWNGRQMLYGDGDGTRMISLSGGLDVIAHEMAHGVISNTANLIYENESGAINESIADIFGAFAENKTGEELWLIGEDIWTPHISGDGLRSMSDPASVYIGGYTEDGYYPDHYSKRYIGDLNNGGVHVNSSINNKAAYLLTDGGTHYGVTVEGIGKSKAERIYYRALTHYLTPTSGFSEMREAAIQAARDLFPDVDGEASSEVLSVMAAYDAVGVE